MADWRSQLQAASFRGVPFSVLGADGEIGRRNVLHEYPLRDIPYAEDLGRKARQFSVEGLVIGADYMAARDRLIQAIEAPGTGELVHPYRGRQQVVVMSARVTESTAEGGLARFSITFAESGQPLNPAAVNDTQAAVLTAADTAQSAAESAFSSVMEVAGYLDFVTNEALGNLNDTLNSLRLSANGLLSGALMPEFVHTLTGISYNATALLRTPLDLAQGLFGVGRGLSGLSAAPLLAFQGLRGLWSFGDRAKPVSGSTAGRKQQAKNQQALINLTRQVGLIEAARVSRLITPASYGDAIMLRDDLAEALETEAETADDSLYTALTGLRIAVIQDINARAADFSRSVQYPVPRTLPALVLSHRIYGDIAQAEDLIARNKIRHPGFVPGGQSIEVLTP